MRRRLVQRLADIKEVLEEAPWAHLPVFLPFRTQPNIAARQDACSCQGLGRSAAGDESVFVSPPSTPVSWATSSLKLE
jgi:hypothetical protein